MGRGKYLMECISNGVYLGSVLGEGMVWKILSSIYLTVEQVTTPA